MILPVVLDRMFLNLHTRQYLKKLRSDGGGIYIYEQGIAIKTCFLYRCRILKEELLRGAVLYLMDGSVCSKQDL